MTMIAPEPAEVITAAQAVADWITRHPILGAVLYLIIGALGKVTPVPGGILLMLSAGFLFGPVAGPVLAATGAGLSALVVAAVGRNLFPNTVERLWGRRLMRYGQALARDGFFYLLALRLVPVIPAWLVNLVPIAIDIRYRTVFLATVIGVTPVSVIVGRLGGTLKDISDTTTLAPTDIMTTETVLLLSALALISLAPIVARRFQRARR
ncbi:MAG: TVP38/TMEM64 family protein [Alphaproteobacteria bacterium]|nr:TVP38/TMEM64 family protein [Alphaproteobacteria bacterium]